MPDSVNDTLLWIIGASFFASILGVAFAALILLLPSKFRNQSIPQLISFSIGTLLGASFMAILPHALEHESVRDPHAITRTLLAGILIFFVLEKLVIWRHCHRGDCEGHSVDSHEHKHSASGFLITLGDGIHNFVDGIMITAAFLTDVHLGVVTTLAIVSHEIPQEMGDFVILLHNGYSRKKAFFLNILASTGTFVGALIAYYSLSHLQKMVPHILAFAAASFVYIALADLLPTLHKKFSVRTSVMQIFLILTGILFVSVLDSWLHHG